MKGHITFDLPHGPGNSRNSEGAFATLTDGRILFAYTRYMAGSGADDDHADIAGLYSADGGRTWPGELRILVPNEGARNVMSVSFLRLPDGPLGMIYLRKNGPDDCCPFLRVSADEGGTWSGPVRLVPYVGYFCLNNDRVIQLQNGRLLAPISEHRHVARLPGAGGSAIDQRGTFFVVRSDDGGKTWSEGSERWTLPSGRDYLQEPGAVELNDGRLWVWMRTNTGRQWQTFSVDHGDSWTLPKPSRFHSPVAPLSMKRIPATGDLLAVWDDAVMAVKLWGESKKLPAGGWGRDKSWGRTPLVAALSRDNGKTWSRSRLIEREPDHGYCYTAIHFVEDAVLLAYNCGGGKTSHVLQDLRIRRIPLGWFYGEKGRSAAARSDA